jgi:hypothetical protein
MHRSVTVTDRFPQAKIYFEEYPLSHGNSVLEELRCFSKAFYAESITRKGGKNDLIMKENLWENNLNFVNDVTMRYVKYTTYSYVITVLREREKKRRR